EYDELVDELCRFLDGETDEIVQRLQTQMKEAAGELEFERAARLRDRLTAVRSATQTPVCSTACRRCSERSRSSRWSSIATRTSTSSASPTTSSRPRCRSS